MEIVKSYLVAHKLGGVTMYLLENGQYLLDLPGNAFLPARLEEVSEEDAKTLIKETKKIYEKSEENDPS